MEQLFQSDDVTVTTTQVLVGGSAYPVHGIASVHTRRVAFGSALEVLLVVLGVFLILGGSCSVVCALPWSSWKAGAIGGVMLAAATGSIFAAVHAGRRRRPPVFHVLVTLASGQVVTLVARDEDTFRRMHAAVLQATGRH